MNIFKRFMNKQYKKAIANAELRTEKRVRDEMEYKISCIKGAHKFEIKTIKRVQQDEIFDKNNSIYALEKKNKDILDLFNKKFPEKIADYKMYLHKLQGDVRFKEMQQEGEIATMKQVLDKALLSVEAFEKVNESVKKKSNVISVKG